MPICIGALGAAGRLLRRRSMPGARLLVMAVHTRSARSGSDAMDRAACISSAAVSPCRLRITRRVESRIKLSSVLSSAKRSRSTIVCTKVESSTAEVGSLLPLHPNPATSRAASTTAKERAIICCNGIWVGENGEEGSARPRSLGEALP